ncbi:DnaB-like helicase C-terminal domain-containing protein [Rodentibacter pneumotropicus]|uniref:DnaB-like helicase C-terminal domain-containing protein n=1 Tax=Rodentibacter pneumotropicus TaxID=758 RepID=UPI001EE3383B
MLFFSLEMGNFQLVDRLLSATGQVGVKKLRNPQELNELDYKKVSDKTGNSIFVDKCCYLAGDHCKASFSRIDTDCCYRAYR